VQDLFLDGKRAEACAALPDDFIDMVSLCGPPSFVAERIAAFREAGVGTLNVIPVAATQEDRLQQVRWIAELAA